MKIGYLPCYVGSSIFPFDTLFSDSLQINKIEQVKECDAILLWGGEDIWPGYYDQGHHEQNQNYGCASSRDQHEWAAMLEAQKLDIPIIGVCRGAQFLCAFAGGSLVQHMSGHHHDHSVMCLPIGWKAGDPVAEAKVYQVSSEHHQMMYCEDMPQDEYEILAWAAGISKIYQNDKGDMPVPARGFFTEPEVVHFSKVRGFAIQGHPEWMNADSPFVQWCMKQIEAYLFAKELV